MTDVPLTRRMRHITALVPPCDLLIEVGADNAYMSIWLLKSGKAVRAAAADVNDGPLRRAAENRERYGVPDMPVIKSDGLSSPALREIVVSSSGDRCLLIAGMGGALTCRILKECDYLDRFRCLVLAPQSEVRDVRRFLEDAGRIIIAEDMVLEQGKYYPVICAGAPDEEFTEHLKDTETIIRPHRMNESEAAFGPVLLRSRHPVLRSYLESREQTVLGILEELRAHGAHTEREAELELELRTIREAEAYYEMQ